MYVQQNAYILNKHWYCFRWVYLNGGMGRMFYVVCSLSLAYLLLLRLSSKRIRRRRSKINVIFCVVVDVNYFFVPYKMVRVHTMVFVIYANALLKMDTREYASVISFFLFLVCKFFCRYFSIHAQKWYFNSFTLI